MNPVALTIINPLKEYWSSRGSNQRPPVLKAATLPNELWGSASKVLYQYEIEWQKVITDKFIFDLYFYETFHFVLPCVLFIPVK